MKQIKRWISSLLVLCMMMSMVPVTVHAETASGTCGENLTWMLSDDGVLTISGTGPMDNYSSGADAPWYSSRSSITTVNIKNGVTTIGNSAFSYCTNLTSVEIPDSVTTIGDGAFFGCDSLRSVEIPDSVTAIGIQAFFDCDSLSSVEIPDSVTAIGIQAFSYCANLTSVDIPDSVTSISDGAFAGCYSLSSVEIPDSVTIIGDGAFFDCDSLSSVEIPDSVTTIGDNAFDDCDSLSSVVIGNSVTTIGNEAFRYCDSLTSVVIGNSVTTIGDGAFYNCDSLTGFYVDENNPNYSSDSWGVLYDKEKTTLIQAPGAISGSYVIPDSVTAIGIQAFYYCYSLTSVEIPDSVTTIGNEAFYACVSLTSVEIGDSVTSVEIGDSVTTIGNYAFIYCDSLRSVVIGNSVTIIGDGAFYDCDSLSSVEIPDSVTTIGDDAFDDCDSLSSVVIGNSVTTIGKEAFRYCDSLRSVVIGTSVTTIGNFAFENCDSLRSVEIPDSVTSIGDDAFYACDSLSSVMIGNSVTTIGDYAFAYCDSLSNVEIPDSVTSIGNYAFEYCDSLSRITFTGDAPSIGSYAFYGATATGYYPANDPTWTSDVMQDYGGTITWVPYEVEGGGGETESASKVRYFREWDAENQIAYFDNDLLLGSQVTEETDTSFLVDVDNLVGHYVLAETKVRDDSDVAPDTLISIKPVETKTGTVSAADDETITIDGVVYVTPEDEFWPSALVDDVVLYHLHEGELVGIELLVTEEGRQTYWNTNNRQIIIDNTEYTLSELADAETIGFLGNSGYADKSVRYLADKAHFVYNVVKYIPPEDVVHYETFKPMPEDQSILHDYVTDWNDAYQGFVDAVHNALKEYSGTDEATKESIIAAEAARMKKADQEDNAGYITGDLHGYEDLAYKALATFIYDYSTETAELSSIDVMDVMAGAALVNNISKSIRGESKEYRYGKVTISITAISAMGSEFGSLTCTAPEGTYTVPVCSTLEECEESISAYLLELRDLATNSAYNIASSIYTDILGKPLYLLTSEYMNKQAAKIERKLAVNLSEKLNLAGVGELFSTLDECYTYYTWMCKPINLGDLDDLQNIVNKTINLKFEDTTIKNAVVNKALKKLRNAARDLDNAAQLYLDGTLVEKENSFWNFLFNCPVNIAVFNSNGEQIGYVSDDDIWYTNVLKITELGGAKEITALTDDLLSFTITSTDYGTMSCSFEEYGDDFEPIGRLNYYDIALEPDMTFNVTMVDNLAGNADTLAITTNVGAILADEYVSVDQDATVFVTANPFADNGQEGGSVFGVGTFVRGDAVVLVAEPQENYKFVGWYVDDTMVSVDTTYEFTAMENASLTARFFYDSYFYVDVDSEKGGSVIGSGRYSDNETAAVFAFADENYTFSGWYTDDALISKDSEYSFVVTEDITITAHFSMLEHSFSDDWSYDTTKHWHECVDGDGVRSDEAEHVPGDTATETSPQVCTVCGYEIMPATGHITHVTTLVSAVEATCEHTGNIAYYTCSGCDLWFEDAEATKVIEDHDSVIIPLADHSYEAAVTAPTCTEQGYTTHTCSNCGDSYVDTYVDATGHCFSEWTESKAATCTEKGEETRTCACGETETREIKALGHTYQDGICNRCGEYDPDYELPTEPSEPDEPGRPCWDSFWDWIFGGWWDDEKCDHEYTSVITAPTCDQKGYNTHTCDKCGDSYKDSYTNALGHQFENGVCTECGKTEKPGGPGCGSIWDWIFGWWN